MKIHDSNVQGHGANGVGRTGPVEEGARQIRRSAGPGGNSVDQVSLSELSAAIAASQSDSADRTAYLEALSAQFAAGEYRVDAGAVAGALLSDASQSVFEE